MKAKCLVFLIVPAFIVASCSVATVVAPPSVAPAMLTFAPPERGTSFADPEGRTVEAPPSAAPGMLTFTSPEPGVSFAYREGWTVNAPPWAPSEHGSHLVSLYPPAGDPRYSHIDIVYMGSEIETGQDLLTWSKMHFRLSHGGGLPEPPIVDARTFVDAYGDTHQLVHQTTTIEGRVQAVLLSNGRLVLCINVYTHNEAMTAVLKELAASVAFAPDAPKTLNELLHTNRQRTSMQASLATISAGREEVTCDLVCQDATATAKITPGTPPTPSQEYLEQEKKFNERMMTRAAYTRTPTPTRTATPTPIPASRPGYAIYEGIGYNGSRNGRGTYRITYSTTQWRVERNETQRDVLRQLQIPACTLQLRSTDREATPPFVRDTLMVGKLVWSRLSMPNGGIITYALDAYEDYFVLELTLLGEAAATQVQQCRAAAEEVIVTFELINPPW